MRDASAFRVLVDRHAPVLHRIAWRMLGDAMEAEDVAQESLLRLWDHASGWKPAGGGLPAWLRRIATNLCLDRLRRGKRISDAPIPETPDPSPGAERLVDRDRLATATRAALSALPDRQRAAVVLTYYEQLSNADAAATLGVKVKALESLLVRGRSSLRERLSAEGVSAQDLGEGA